ncbi:MAG TPA: pyridoxal-dependent decarboxylase [Anaerolineales bacterium]
MELDPTELQNLGERVVEFITRYLVTLQDQIILPEGLSPQSLHSLMNEPLPRKPQGVEAAFQDFQAKIAANSARVGHPRFMGWIRTSPLAVAIYSEALAATLNQSVAVWDGAPAATEVELRVIEWLKEMSGYAPEAGGLLVSGGSMANFVCLQAARAAADPQARLLGLAGQPPFTIYITRETHYCISKAAEMMGIGRRFIRKIPVDAALRMDPNALAEQIQADRQAGLRPMAVAATLGTVNSGACDDLIALGQVCRELGVWLHVDGAYGGLSALVPEKRHLAAGLSEADSLVFDPHKGLYVPFEAGCALVLEPAYLRQAFSMEADYLPNTDDDGTGPFHFRDYGPQLSRSFRALKIYMALKAYGVEAIAGAIARQYQLAAELARRVQADPELELLAPVQLGIVAFRYRGSVGITHSISSAELDLLNTQVVQELQRRGRVFLSSTHLQNQVALRACFVSYRTQESDLELILDEVRSAGRALWPRSGDNGAFHR